MTLRIDLNADVGEGLAGPDVAGDDELLTHVTSANIACGFHAGNPSLMRATVDICRRHDVAVGAHPSLPDREGFGRRELRMPASELESVVIYQLGALEAIAASVGVPLRHVKPHGALYNMAARDRELAEAVARAVFAFDRELFVYAPPRSALASAARAIGLRVAGEGFADRGYRHDGSLVPRNEPGAVIANVEEVVTRALQMAVERTVTAVDGSPLTIDVDTLCIHGDTPGASAMAAWLRAGLASADVDVRAPGA